MGLELVRLDGSLCHRLIASRFPTVSLFDHIADPADLDVVFAIESLTNPRLRQELGELSLVPVQERVSGAGAKLIMAAFTHLNPLGSSFSDGSYGVYYAAQSLETTLAEFSHHRAKFLSRTAEPELDLDMRWLQAEVVEPLGDLQGKQARHPEAYDPEAYDPDDYGSAQVLGRVSRDSGSAGLVYDSVRHAGGQCVAIFKPKALRRARAAGHLGLHWEGLRITHWFHKGAP